MAKNKTTPTASSVTDYLNAIADEKKRQDCAELVHLITAVTGLEPKMWGTAIVGFGSYHYHYESGHQGDAPLTGLAARANAITLYLAANFEHKQELLQQFGKYKRGQGCLYFKKLEDINTDILRQLIRYSVDQLKQQDP